MKKATKKQRPPLSVRVSEDDESRYAALAEKVGVSLSDWVRETLAARASRMEEWIRLERYFRDGSGRIQFIDDFPPEEQERMAKLLKGK